MTEDYTVGDRVRVEFEGGVDNINEVFVSVDGRAFNRSLTKVTLVARSDSPETDQAGTWRRSTLNTGILYRKLEDGRWLKTDDGQKVQGAHIPRTEVVAVSVLSPVNGADVVEDKPLRMPRRLTGGPIPADVTAIRPDMCGKTNPYTCYRVGANRWWNAKSREEAEEDLRRSGSVGWNFGNISCYFPATEVIEDNPPTFDPRVFIERDKQPRDYREIRLRDRDGDVWIYSEDRNGDIGWNYRDDSTAREWNEVLDYAPLTEVVE